MYKVQAGMAGRRMDGEWTGDGRRHSHVHHSFYLLQTSFLPLSEPHYPFFAIMGNVPKMGGWI